MSRWILVGKNDVSIHALELMLRHGDDVWVIAVAGDDGKDGWQRSLAGAARRLGVRCDQPPKINDPAFVERLAAYHATALLSVQYDQILKANLFERIGCPCLNLHFALLPRHRGVSPIAWAILAGDREAGVTLHHMVVDIDAGDLVAQRAVPIIPGQTGRELYDRVVAASNSLLDDCFPFTKELFETRLVQDHAAASYHRSGDFDFSRRATDWSEPADRLHRWLCAMIFPPWQHPEITWKGATLQIRRIGGEIGAATAAAPGTVLARSTEGLAVAVRGGVIRIVELVDPARPDSPSVLESVQTGDRFS